MASTAKERLQRRAKIRRWFDRWKKRILVAFLVVVLIFIGLASQAHRLKDRYIKEINEYVEVNDRLPDWALESMYKLAYFLDITLREDQAKDCYQTILDWTYDGQIVLEGAELRMQDEYDVYPNTEGEALAAQDSKYIGFAMFRYIKLIEKSYKQQAQIYRALYMRDVYEQNSDPAFDALIQHSFRMYKAGG